MRLTTFDYIWPNFSTNYNRSRINRSMYFTIIRLGFYPFSSVNLRYMFKREVSYMNKGQNSVVSNLWTL
jgi:hypothetical protein